MCPGVTQNEVLAVVSGETLETNDSNYEDSCDDEANYLNMLSSKKDRKLSMDSTFEFLDCDNNFRGPRMITFDGKFCY